MTDRFPKTLGIEEEYLLVDRDTGALAKSPPEALLHECQRRHKGQVSPEFLRSQIEVGTTICTSLQEARDQLADLRGTIAEVASDYNLTPIAASTHPFARWKDQVHTNKSRYATLVGELQGVARRMVICGMHVHVGIEDQNLRIDLMNQVKYFLPHLLSFSTSSPFWSGADTGLKSYRLTIFDNLPRTGLPEFFSSYSEYEEYAQTLIKSGVIQDTSKLWWDVRPSANFPTLEMRISDVCTRLEDGMAVAAFYLCLISHLERLKRRNQKWRVYSSALIRENRWRAQRYGLDEGLVDLGRQEIVSWTELIDEIEDLLIEDAERLGCVKELKHLHTILARGTSAHKQVEVYQSAIGAGVHEEEALREVTRMLMRETLIGV
jgi:glutamate---cysteine ligase / carboxylate-amine ligase